MGRTKKIEHIEGELVTEQDAPAKRKYEDFHPKNKEKLEARMVEKYKSKSKGDCEPLENGDMTAILNLIVDRCERYGGRGSNYPATPDGFKSFLDVSREYFDYLNTVNEDENLKRKLIPDIESWALYLGISRMTIFEYEKRGGQWSEAIQFYRNAIGTAKKQLALNYKIPPMVYVFDATNNHDYVNSNEFKLTARTELVQNDMAQIERDMAVEGVAWDPEQGKFVPIEGNN